MSVLITGAKGMLGRSLCRCFRRKGKHVIEADLPEFDITDLEKTVHFIRQIKPKTVFHCAAFTDVDGCEQEQEKARKINVLGTRAVVSGVSEINAEMVFISTDYVFDGETKRPYSEEDIPCPLNYYGKTKLLGEEMVKKNLDRFMIIRTSGLYGKDGRNFVSTIIEKALYRDSLEIVSDQYCSPTYIEDLSEGLFALYSTHRHGIFHVVNSGSCSWFQFAEEILKLSGLKTRMTPVTSDYLNRPARRPQFSTLSNRLFHSIVPHAMRTWREALADYIAIASQD